MRNYNPALGRFLSQDMLIRAVGLGRISPAALAARGITLPILPYVYAGHRPVTMVDPLGLQESGMGTVTFEDCGDPLFPGGKTTQKNITDALSKCCEKFKKALNGLDNYDKIKGQLDRPTAALLAGQIEIHGSSPMATGGPSEPTKQSVVDYLKDIFKRAVKKCEEGFTVECECSCKEGQDAYVPFGVFGYGDIHICKEPFSSGALTRLEEILCHEISHYGGSLDEGGYRSGLGNVWTSPEIPGTQIPSILQSIIGASGPAPK